MATGPEHYREAERLMGDYERQLAELIERGGGWMSTPPVLTAAQVHAQLAQAAAEALRWSVTGRDIGPQCKAWGEAIGTEATAGDSAALDAIAAVMGGQDSDGDTFARVAALVSGTGRPVSHPGSGRGQIACTCCDVRSPDGRDPDTECHGCGHLWRDHKGR